MIFRKFLNVSKICYVTCHALRRWKLRHVTSEPAVYGRNQPRNFSGPPIAIGHGESRDILIFFMILYETGSEENSDE